MKIERATYGIGHRRLFFISENEDSSVITVNCYRPLWGKKEYTLTLLESGVYYFDFCFKDYGKYVFIFFENGNRKFIMVTTII